MKDKKKETFESLKELHRLNIELVQARKAKDTHLVHTLKQQINQIIQSQTPGAKNAQDLSKPSVQQAEHEEDSTKSKKQHLPKPSSTRAPEKNQDLEGCQTEQSEAHDKMALLHTYNEAIVQARKEGNSEKVKQFKAKVVELLSS